MRSISFLQERFPRCYIACLVDSLVPACGWYYNRLNNKAQQQWWTEPEKLDEVKD